MIHFKHNELTHFQFPNLPADNVTHAVFGRQGGVSSSPFDTLNVGLTIGDEPHAVAENTRRMAASLGLDGLPVVWPRQVHSADVVQVSHGDAWSPQEAPEADAIITDVPDIVLMMRFADCVPVLMYDPHNHALGMAHAGWRGTVADVSGATVRAMQAAFGSDPSAIVAGIGPSICGACYEVGSEVIEAAHAAFGRIIEPAVRPQPTGNPHFDLWAANRIALEAAGVVNVTITGLCTLENPAAFFSHRGEQGRTGRFGVMAALQ